MSHYLKQRTNLCLVFALIDSGLEPQEMDVEFVEWLARNAVPVRPRLHQDDKVTSAAVQANIAAFTARIAAWFEKLPAIFTCSATTEQGRQELLGVIDEAMTAIQAGLEQTTVSPEGLPPSREGAENPQTAARSLAPLVRRLRRATHAQLFGIMPLTKMTNNHCSNSPSPPSKPGERAG